MFSGSARQWDPTEWEEFAHTLLSLRYGHSEYQRVPSTHGGDCGIEGFSFDGGAYQCYAAQHYTSVNDLFEKQRDKMTDDVKKFRENNVRLEAIFGSLKIRRWFLFVPEHSSAKLVAHAAKKTSEVLDASLSYIASDFRVSVLTADDFHVEQIALTNRGGATVEVDQIVVGQQEVDAFHEAPQNSQLLQTLEDKLLLVPTLALQPRKQILVHELTKGYLRGQASLSQLHDNYPEIHKKVVAFKQRKENALALLSAASVVRPEELLDRHLKELAEQIEAEIPSIAPMLADIVAECIADWLMRCPLRFFPAA